MPPGEVTKSNTGYAKDFECFWQFIAEEYAYLAEKRTDWSLVRKVYGPEATAAGDDRTFLKVLERASRELYDPHVGFNTNSPHAPRLIPTGTDLWAAWQDGRATVTEIRRGSNGERSGARRGMVIRKINDRPVKEVIHSWMPLTVCKNDPAARDWALRVALAGMLEEPIRLAADLDGEEVSFEFVPNHDRPHALLSVVALESAIGYVRINNTLDNHGLVAAFDSVLSQFRHTRGLVLDLRDTPSGGNSTVARGIMSRLVDAEHPYQRHELESERRAYGVRRVWLEYVLPRGPFTYTQPVIVLVGRWTGSMGEGLAVGLDGMSRATTVGTPMAGLLGAISESRLPNTGIVARVPTERLAHVNGTPREAFVPSVVVPELPKIDAQLERAINILVSG